MSFDKDAFIKAMLARRYLIAREDGVILRANKADARGRVDLSKGYSVVAQQVHKPTGRVYFNVSFMGVRKSVLTNRIVALRFHPNPKNLPMVNHIDGNKENNAAANLEWASASENEKHAHATGLKSGRGSANANAKLTAETVRAIRASTDPAPVLAERYGVARSTVSNILKRRTWRHV